MGKIIRLFDRSRVVEDWKCSRARYWRYEFAGRGIVPAGTSLELFLGTTVHDGLSTIAAMHKESGKVDIDVIATTAQKQVYQALLQDNPDDYETLTYASEQAALIEGMLRGFYKHAWPRLISQYPEIVAIEQEMTYTLPGGRVFMSKPDLVVADKEGNYFYVEYKTTSSKKAEWVNSWNTAVQLHSTMRAIQESLNHEVTGVIVQGLYKGYESYGKQSSPFCYAYKRNGNPPFTKDEVTYEYKAGFRRVPVWEMSGGVREWVSTMPENILADQFLCTPPIFLNEALVDDFFAQRNFREGEIDLALSLLNGADEEAKKNVLNAAFPQKFDQCIPYFGRPCAYRNLCFGHVENPLLQGYSLRESHHELEREQHDAQNASVKESENVRDEHRANTEAPVSETNPLLGSETSPGIAASPDATSGTSDS